MFKEKFPLFLPSMNSSSVVVVEPVVVSLEEKAAIFLAVIQQMITIFDFSGAWQNDDDKQSSFIERMARYENYCRDLINSAAQVTKFGGSAAATRPRYPLDEVENAELDDAIKGFDHLIETFFKGFESPIQGNILDTLTREIANRGREAKFLQRMEERLRQYKLLIDRDHTYNYRRDALLDTCCVPYAIETVPTDKNFLYFNEWKLRCPDLDLRAQVIGSSDVPSQQSRRREEEKGPLEQGIEAEEDSLEQVFSLLTDEDVYAEIEINDTLFQQKEFKGRDIRKLFQELVKTSHDFEERLNRIKENLSIRARDPKIKKSDEVLIQNLQQELSIFIPLQTQFKTACGALISDEFDSQKTIEYFLNIYDGEVFAQQMQYLPRLLERLGNVNGFFESDCFVQTCTRRKQLAEEIFKRLPLDNHPLADTLKSVYKQICYVLQKSQLILDIKKRGYICPPGMKKLMEELEASYGVADILNNPRVDALLKKSFLLFAKTIDGGADKLKFFQEIYPLLDSKRSQPLCLEDLKPLRHYFNEKNSLRLARNDLNKINAAFDSKEISQALTIKNIIAAFLPALTGLKSVLKDLQFSYDIVDILLDVPGIKERLKGVGTLAALSQEDIAGLPSFWREIFTHENSILAKAFSDKKILLELSDAMTSTIEEALTYHFGSNKLIIDMEYSEMFLTQVENVFDAIKYDGQCKKIPNVKLLAQKQLAKIKTNLKGEEVISNLDENIKIKDVLKQREKELINILNKELERKITISSIQKQNLHANEIVLYEHLKESLQQDRPRICMEVLKALRGNKEFIGCLTKSGENGLTCERSDEKRGELFEKEVMYKQKFVSLIKHALNEKIKEECVIKLKKEEQILFIKTRNAIAIDFIRREVGRQIKLLEKANIFHEYYLKTLRKHEENICNQAQKKLSIFEEKDTLFLSNYARVLLEIPSDVMKALANSIEDELVEGQNIFNTDFVAVHKLNLDEKSLKELLLKESEDYLTKNKRHFEKMKKASSSFRLFAIIREKSDSKMYEKLGEKICAASKKDNSTKTRGNLAPKTPMDLGIRLLSGEKPRSNVGLSTPLRSPSIVSCGTKGNFQSLVENVEQKISADRSGRWDVKKYIQSDATDELDECDNTTACNFIKVFDRSELVFTATAGIDESRPIPEEDIRVTAYRHKPDDIAMAVGAMVESMHAMEKTILDISIADFISEKEVSELVKQYVAEALKQGVLPRVTLEGVTLEYRVLQDRLQAIDPSLASKYHRKIRELSKSDSSSKNSQRFFPTCSQEELTLNGKSSTVRALFT